MFGVESLLTTASGYRVGTMTKGGSLGNAARTSEPSNDRHYSAFGTLLKNKTATFRRQGLHCVTNEQSEVRITEREAYKTLQEAMEHYFWGYNYPFDKNGEVFYETEVVHFMASVDLDIRSNETEA